MSTDNQITQLIESMCFITLLRYVCHLQQILGTLQGYL